MKRNDWKLMSYVCRVIPCTCDLCEQQATYHLRADTLGGRYAKFLCKYHALMWNRNELDL